MRKSIVMAAALAAVGLSGCVAFYDSSSVAFEEEKRQPVKFDSSGTAKLFHAKVLAAGNRSPFIDSSHAGMLGVYFGKTKTFHETSYYNYCVRKVDYNGDGVITTEEMNAYLGSSE